MDIEKPFEVFPLEPECGFIEYIDVQYIIYGNDDGFLLTEICGVRIERDDVHPTTDIDEPHFVISAGPIRLKWRA